MSFVKSEIKLCHRQSGGNSIKNDSTEAQKKKIGSLIEIVEGKR